MSAHSIVDPQYRVDTADVPPLLAGTEQTHLAHSRVQQSTVQQAVYEQASNAAEALANASPWVVSGARRGFDSVVAALALILLLPPMFLIMLLVLASSPGPILFRQRRAGRNREEFTLYKFRSMRVENSPGPAITVSGDTRITPIGAFLRRFKLDELPQFWNVLQGNMSLVGPRPKLPHHEGLDLPYRPGITGMATLLFRNEEEILSGIPHYQLEAFYETCIKPRKALLDLEYMQSATLWTDLKLIWRTAACCVFGSDNLSSEETVELTRLAAEWPDPSCGKHSGVASPARDTLLEEVGAGSRHIN
ncbi:MAG TPA: sugar transferase [Silvibacterium sp.]|nr:sugar transferase [Silvibacterium sp.]